MEERCAINPKLITQGGRGRVYSKVYVHTENIEENGRKWNLGKGKGIGKF